MKPEQEIRPMSEQEAKAYAHSLQNMLPQFHVMCVIGREDNGFDVCVTMESVNADGSVYLGTPHEITNFLNFLKMQQLLEEQ